MHTCRPIAHLIVQAPRIAWLGELPEQEWLDKHVEFMRSQAKLDELTMMTMPAVKAD